MGAAPLKEAPDAAGRCVFPDVDHRAGGDPSWADTLDTLRTPRKREQPFWEWRRESALRPVVFDDPGTMTGEVVHLHLEHRVGAHGNSPYGALAARALVRFLNEPRTGGARAGRKRVPQAERYGAAGWKTLKRPGTAPGMRPPGARWPMIAHADAYDGLRGRPSRIAEARPLLPVSRLCRPAFARPLARP
jgi:hypothetical protein